MIRRVVSKIKFYSNLKHISRLCCSGSKVSLSAEDASTLFVPGRRGAQIYQIVKPVIDVQCMNDNLCDLKFSCEHRGITLDLENVLRLAKEWLDIRDKYLAMVEKSKENIDKLHRSSSANDFKLSNEKRNEVMDKLDAEKRKLHDIEDIVMPLIKKIPNLLHAHTPLQYDVVESCQKPSSHKSEVKSHVHIARNALHFTKDPIISYYMSGKLAVLELAIELFFVDRLNALNFSQLSCMDFCKSFILEAIGADPHSSLKVKEKGAPREIGQKLHLCGGASFEAFCVYLTNMNVNKATLPVRYFSLGRRYDVANKDEISRNLFSVVQSTNIHYVVLSESSLSDSLFKSIEECYLDLDVPYRIVNVAAKNLSIAESRRKQVELWSPALGDYVPVASISQHEDFVSKRLQITYGIEYIKEGYCDIVEGTFVNIPRLIGCIVENFQTTDNDFNIPSVLQKYLL